MYWTKKHVLVCTASHCSQKGANDVVGKLRLDIVRKGLDTEILINNCGTIDLCDIGPNMIVYPDNVILSGVTVKDIPEIVEFLRGGQVVDRLVLDRTSAGESRRRAAFSEAWGDSGSRSAEEFTGIILRHGFDDAWIAEQQRRGFIARKPGESGDMITITKKARDRYTLAN